MPLLRIATRKSLLAMWQSEYVAARLRMLCPDLDVVLVPMSTRGDEILDRSWLQLVVKGCFSRSWNWRCYVVMLIARCIR